MSRVSSKQWAAAAGKARRSLRIHDVRIDVVGVNGPRLLLLIDMAAKNKRTHENSAR